MPSGARRFMKNKGNKEDVKILRIYLICSPFLSTIMLSFYLFILVEMKFI